MGKFADEINSVVCFTLSDNIQIHLRREKKFPVWEICVNFFLNPKARALWGKVWSRKQRKTITDFNLVKSHLHFQTPFQYAKARDLLLSNKCCNESWIFSPIRTKRTRLLHTLWWAADVVNVSIKLVKQKITGKGVYLNTHILNLFIPRKTRNKVTTQWMMWWVCRLELRRSCETCKTEDHRQGC